MAHGLVIYEPVYNGVIIILSSVREESQKAPSIINKTKIHKHNLIFTNLLDPCETVWQSFERPENFPALTTNPPHTS